MAFRILNNKLGRNVTVVVDINTSADVITLASLALPGETVTGATITQFMGSGACNVKRGANTVIALNTGALHVNLKANEIPITLDATATIVVTTAATGSMILELQKQSTYNTEY